MKFGYVPLVSIDSGDILLTHSHQISNRVFSTDFKLRFTVPGPKGGHSNPCIKAKYHFKQVVFSRSVSS